MKVIALASAVICGAMVFAALPAQAACVTKSAVATSGSASSAKWFALETMVQSVSWGLWPGFVATGNVAGYRISKQRYKCSPDSFGVKCHGTATFCKTG